MVKVALFVCISILGLILVTSVDTDSESDLIKSENGITHPNDITEATITEKNVSKETMLETSGKSTENENVRKSRRRRIRPKKNRGREEEDKKISTIETEVTASTEIQPNGNMEISTHQISGINQNENCFCKYENDDEFVSAQVGHRILKFGDTIGRGETVSFECRHVGTVLTFQNGLRLSRKANITCSKCEKWQKTDVPICTYYERSDATVGFIENLHILPGGNVKVDKGVRHRFSCSNIQRQPEWNYGQRKNVSATIIPISESGSVKYYITYLDIGKEEVELGGVYECYTRNENGQRTGSTFLHLQVTDSVSCPDFPDLPELQVTYSKDVSVGSVARFSCSQATKILIGSNTSRCQENGSWSNPLPSCEGGCVIPRIRGGSLKEEKLGDWYWNWRVVHWDRSLTYIPFRPGTITSSGTELWFYCDKPTSVHGTGKQRILIRCLRGKWSTELQCLYDGESLITSTATPGLNRLTSASNLSRSTSATEAKYLPSSTLNPVITEEASSFGIDDTGPEVVVSPLPNQGPPKKECFCIYPLEESNIVALADGRQLIYGDRVRKGSTIIFHCLYVGYHRFMGNREITCRDCEPWDFNEFPACLPPEKGNSVCSAPPDIAGAVTPQVEGNEHPVDTTVTYSCPLGYVSRNPINHVSVCKINSVTRRAEWTIPEISCNRNSKCYVGDLLESIPDSVQPDISADLEEYVTFGFEVRLKCTENKVMTGEGNAQCGEQGKWKLDSFMCVPGCILNLDPSSHLVVQPMKDRYRIGESVVLSCPPGEELSYKVEIIMCVFGGWSDSLPECTEKQRQS